MKIYRTTDRIPVKLGDLTFWFSPFKWEHKIEVSTKTLLKSGETSITASQARLAIKYSIKAVDGLMSHDGTPIILELENDVLTDDSVEDVMQLENISKLTTIAFTWLNEIKDVAIEGVTVDFSSTTNTKKK